MIINAPTGLYSPILPGINESGNITYTISNNNPPRSPETFIQLPSSEEIRKLPNPIWTKNEKRQFYGSLIFNISIPSESSVAFADDKFDIGQVLEFSDSELESDPYTLNKIELRQDLKVVDFNSAGLTEEEYDELVSASEKRIDELTNEINIKANRLKDNADNISHNQALINNSNDILDNILIVFGDDHPSAEKVRNKISELEIEREELISNRSILQDELDDIRSKLQKVRESVR